MRKSWNVLPIAFVIGLGLWGIPDPETLSERMHFISEHNHTKIVPIPDQIDFCDEFAPIENEDAQERLTKELLTNTYWHSNTLQILKRSTRYLPVLQKLLEEHGVPKDFIYLAIIESGLTPVVSPAGAAGFWQLMPNTAREYGLVVNDEIDERFHLEKSTYAAIKYLKEAKKRFGSWTLAAASYNMGMKGLENQLNRQFETDYYNLSLNEETKRYVFRILAMKCIMTEPRAFGFDLSQSDYSKPWNDKLIPVFEPVPSWGKWAHQYGMSYNELKRHNPWLKDSKLGESYPDTLWVAVTQ